MIEMGYVYNLGEVHTCKYRYGILCICREYPGLFTA